MTSETLRRIAKLKAESSSKEYLSKGITSKCAQESDTVNFYEVEAAHWWTLR